MNNAAESTFIPLTKPQPSLADLLTIEPSASIFYSYARELELSAKFDDASVRYTIFVPTNKAVMALARKPYVLPAPLILPWTAHVVFLVDIKGQTMITSEFLERNSIGGRGATSRDGYRLI